MNKLLVVGPNSSFRPWEHEYFEMTGQEPNVARITGKQQDRIAILNSSEFFEIFLVNYFIISKEFQRIKRMLSEDKFMIIVDESHHIKNPNSQAASALLELANSAKKRMILSGTPVPNNFDDLWSQFSFLYPNFQINYLILISLLIYLLCEAAYTLLRCLLCCSYFLMAIIQNISKDSSPYFL